MKELFTIIKNVFKYAKSTILWSWLFFFLLSVSNGVNGILYSIFVSGIMVLFIVIIVSLRKYFKL